MVSSSIGICANNWSRLSRFLHRQMSSNICRTVSQIQTGRSCFNPSIRRSRTISRSSLIRFHGDSLHFGLKQKRGSSFLLAPQRLVNPKGSKELIELSLPCRNLSMRVLAFCMLACYSSYNATYAEAEACDDSHAKLSHGKRVYTDFTVIGIPGDGRCLFRSLAHGACLRSGKPTPDEKLQKELADDLRARVADEFIKRREESEWFVEGDFDTYVAQMRKPNVWGGEPELFMASHVLRMPITVYMSDKDAGGLISIAEYGQEYGKGDPIQVLYHGFGHYDALRIHDRNSAKSKL